MRIFLIALLAAISYAQTDEPPECVDTCSSDGCVGSWRRFNGIPNGEQWITTQREHKDGCCTLARGTCDYCCRPENPNVVGPETTIAPTEEINTPAPGFELDLRNMRGLALSGGGDKSVFTQWPILWSLNKMTTIDDMLEGSIVGTNSGGSWTFNSVMHDLNYDKAFQTRNLNQYIDEHMFNYFNEVTEIFQESVSSNPFSRETWDWICPLYPEEFLFNSNNACTNETLYVVNWILDITDNDVWVDMIEQKFKHHQQTPVRTPNLKWASSVVLHTANSDNGADYFSYEMDGWESESYIPTFLTQDYANGEIVDRDSIALTSDDPRNVRVYNSDNDESSYSLTKTTIEDTMMRELHGSVYNFTAPSSAIFSMVFTKSIIGNEEIGFASQAAMNRFAVKAPHHPVVEANPRLAFVDSGIMDNFGLATTVNRLQEFPPEDDEEPLILQFHGARDNLRGIFDAYFENGKYSIFQGSREDTTLVDNDFILAIYMHVVTKENTRLNIKAGSRYRILGIGARGYNCFRVSPLVFAHVGAVPLLTDDNMLDYVQGCGEDIVSGMQELEQYLVKSQSGLNNDPAWYTGESVIPGDGDDDGSSSGLSFETILLIIGIVAAVLVLIAILYCCCCNEDEENSEKEVEFESSDASEFEVVTKEYARETERRQYAGDTHLSPQPLKIDSSSWSPSVEMNQQASAELRCMWTNSSDNSPDFYSPNVGSNV